MKRFKVLFSILILCSMSVFSQEKNIQHTIVKGETISSIAQKYEVTTTSIYKLNPKAKKTLQLNQILIIPVSDSKSKNEVSVLSEKIVELNHEVLPKETLYGITKQYKTTTELLYKANPKLEAEGLKIGQSIIIPTTGLSKKEIANLSNTKVEETTAIVEKATHEVKPKESLYVIAKQYGISLKELKEANPEIGNKGLSIGQILTIPANGKRIEEMDIVQNNPVIQTEEVIVADSKEAIYVGKDSGGSKENETQVQNTSVAIVHEVLPKETKYGIAKKYGLTVTALEEQNPTIKTKLLVGSSLNIQALNMPIVEPTVVEVASAQPVKFKDSISMPVSLANQELIEQLIQSASGKIGTRYRTGGTTTAGFDCSGLMYSTFGNFDIKLPRSSIEQSSIGEKVSNENAQKGDLIFFKTNGRSRINHVGMVVEVNEDEIKFIHSSTHGGVIISSTKETYYKNHFEQVNRVIK